MDTKPITLLKIKEVMARCNSSKATIYRRIKRKEFPEGIKRSKKDTVWRSGQIGRIL
jgi:predicted DNA-binding transcriptional regulator AlpA